MEVVLPPFADVWIEAGEADAIKTAMRHAGHNLCAESFSGAALGTMLEGWQQFVEEDWTRWDSAEYDNDISVREELEMVLQAVGPLSRARLLAALEPLDARFRSRMRPVGSDDPGAKDSRFWLSNTIWNTPCE